jgi:hypothetical protein
MDEGAKGFFQRYEALNSSSDAARIGELYADAFLFGGPGGVQAVRKEDFLKIIPKMKAYFSSLGVCETRLQTVETTALDPKYLLARVCWKIKLQTPSSPKDLDALASYILARGTEGAFSIVFQIDHQDLASAIKDEDKAQERTPNL